MSEFVVGDMVDNLASQFASAWDCMRELAQNSMDAGTDRIDVWLEFVEGEGILYQLSEVGICASSGSACTSGSLEPSHVLRAMDVPFTAVHGSVRFSLSRYTTDEEIDLVIEVFPRVIESLRKLSPYWDQVKNRPSGRII